MFPTLAALAPHDRLFWIGDIVILLFMFAFGACLGSLTNVLVYRLPLGLNVVTPPSACPSCGTRLTWRENIPVFGWLFLGGKCRFCRSKISAEYPIVELFVGLLFVVTYAMLFGHEDRIGLPFMLGRPGWAPIGLRPEWALNEVGLMWPIGVLWAGLFTCLVAMFLVDSKTFTIPMILTTVPAVLGFLIHTGHATYLQFFHRWGQSADPAKANYLDHVAREGASTWYWAIPTPGPNDWLMVGLAIGGMLGVVFSNAMLRVGVFKMSFADYPDWEKKQLETPGVVDDKGNPTDLWTQYPHARREMIRELIFLAPIVGFAMIGAFVGVKLGGPFTFDVSTQANVAASPVPFWLMVLSGVSLGYLIGGGVVWLVRVLGSLAFGKEAMGLGDVHMMAAVGACLGWIDSTLAFFAGAFVGILIALVGGIFGGRLAKAMPFGPSLAIGTVLVVWGKPFLEVAIRKLGNGNIVWWLP